MKLKNIVTLLFCLPLLTGCFYDRMFELEWDEEVKLHDGQVIVMHRKTSYERLSQGLMPYDGTIIPRDTTISFPEDPDNPNSGKRITQFVKNGGFSRLDRYKGKWVIGGVSASLGQYQPEIVWGPGYGGFIGFLINGKFLPKSPCTSPFAKDKPQFLHLDFRNVSGMPNLVHRKFANTLVTLKDAAEWEALDWRHELRVPERKTIFCKDTANLTNFNDWENENE
jgi:hypothetical protein